MDNHQTIFWKGAHTYHRLLYHIVFVPKYRRRVLQGKVVQRISQLLYQCAEVNQWFIDELVVEPDHVHLLIQLSATISIPKAVMLMKGGTSKVLRHEFPKLTEFLWGKSFWQDGYFVETVGRQHELAIRRYLQKPNQEKREDQTSPVL